MEIYQEIEQRRAERQARREERMRREERIRRIVGPIVQLVEMVFVILLVYFYLFAIAIVDII